MLTFENCHFSPDSTKLIKDFKFNSLKVFRMINCSIVLVDLDQIILSLPTTLTTLHLRSIRCNNRKVLLKFSSFKRLNDLIDLRVENMLLDKVDKIVTQFFRLPNLKNLSFANNKLGIDHFIPNNHVLESLEKRSFSNIYLDYLISSQIDVSIFPKMLKVLGDDGDSLKIDKILLFIKKFRTIILDCKIPNDSDYLYEHFPVIFQLTSHNVNINNVFS